jgi:hypothetical protein
VNVVEGEDDDEAGAGNEPVEEVPTTGLLVLVLEEPVKILGHAVKLNIRVTTTNFQKESRCVRINK